MKTAKITLYRCGADVEDSAPVRSYSNEYEASAEKTKAGRAHTRQMPPYLGLKAAVRNREDDQAQGAFRGAGWPVRCTVSDENAKRRSQEVEGGTSSTPSHGPRR